MGNEITLLNLIFASRKSAIHCKKRGVTEHPRGAIFYRFRGNSMGYHGNSKILLPWGVPIHRVFYSVDMCSKIEHSIIEAITITCCEY